MLGSHQLPLLQVSSGSALVRHDEAVSTINDEGPSSHGPSLQQVSPVDVGGRCPPVDEDHSVTLSLAPTDRLPYLGGDLNAESIQGLTSLAPTGVAFDLDTLSLDKNIVAIEESIRILSDMVDGEASFPQRIDHEMLNFLADLEAALAILTGPI